MSLQDESNKKGLFVSPMGMVLGEWMLDSLVGRPPQLDAQARDERARLCTQLFLGGLGGQ